MKKVELLTTKPRNTCELPQVGRYESGQFYRPHYDAVDQHNTIGDIFETAGTYADFTLACVFF
jgi:hypothetical protein